MVAQSMEPVAPLLTPPRRRDPTPLLRQEGWLWSFWGRVPGVNQGLWSAARVAGSREWRDDGSPTLNCHPGQRPPP